MQELIRLAKETLREKKNLPFSVYLASREHGILNTPIVKPLLVFILEGMKQLGKDGEITCPTGSFIFLSNISSIDMRNIPAGEYLAILIEFDYCNFDQFQNKRNKGKNYFQGTIDDALLKTLQQYIEWSIFAPPELWHFRKEELLQLLYLSGYQEISTIARDPSLSHQLHNIVSSNTQETWSVGSLATKLAVSESTLRRKLKAEGSNIKSIIDNAKLGHGLYLVQTTLNPIGDIAERCGYQSQSRFTHKFKTLFGITPTELRKSL